MPPKSRSKQTTTAQKRKRRDETESEDDGYSANFTGDDIQALDSDDLDDEVADTAKRRRKVGTKRKKNPSPTKSRKRRKKAASEEEESDLELKEGQEVVGKIVHAPKTGLGGLQAFRRRRIEFETQRFRSSSWADISEHARLPEPAQGARIQR